MSDAEDRRLVRDSLAGDPAAFELLVEKYEKVVFNLALGMVRAYEDAEDVTQTAFVKAYEKLETYKPSHRFFSWLYRIAVNESLNLLSRRKKRFEEVSSGIVSTEKTPEENYDDAYLDGKIRTALMVLPMDYRLVIVLRHFLQMSLREIAEILEIPDKTVKSRLFTARQRLGSILLKEGIAKS